MTPTLVFIHGWGFDASFWDDLAPHLYQFPQQRVDLGFFGPGQNSEADNKPKILIGHSLGFMHGIVGEKNLMGWVAINAFARFPRFSDLSAMKLRLQKNPAATLCEFYRHIGAKPLSRDPDIKTLEAGLNELCDKNISDKLNALNIPGLVLASRNDPLVPVNASEDLKRYARGLLWHETGGHMLPQNDAPFCAKAIVDFLATFFG